jgi:hypothetical protein
MDSRRAERQATSVGKLLWTALSSGIMSIKSTIEENIVLSVLGLLAVGFTSGWEAHAALGIQPAREGDTKTDWQAVATKEGWIAKTACPGFPLSLRVISPGDGASVSYFSDYLRTDFIVSASRPLPESEAVGIIFNVEGEANFYVTFPYFEVNQTRTVFRDDSSTKFPMKLEGQKRINLWALVVEDKREVGSVYASLDQIRALSPSIFVSDKVSILTMQN